MMCIVLEHLKTKQFSTLTVYSDVYNNLVTIRIRGKLPVDSCIDFCMSCIMVSVLISGYRPICKTPLKGKGTCL